MSRHGDVMIAWGDGEGPGENGEYCFRLGLAEWRKIDERFSVGPFEMLRRVSQGTWKVDYLREVIRLGLQAGGSCLKGTAVDDQRINRLIREYVDGRPMLQSVTVTAKILEAALWEPQDDQIPKSAAVEGVVPSFQMEDSPLPPLSDGDQPSATRRKKSARSRSGNSARAKPDTSLPTAEKKSSSPQAPMSSTP
jgi:hypothetical protein